MRDTGYGRRGVFTVVNRWEHRMAISPASGGKTLYRDQLVFVQNGEPGGLYCADETDGEALRICGQIVESLYIYEVAGTAPEPGLAEECSANADSSVWTCTLREGVVFHNGATLDANDVVTTFAIQWDAAHPLHVGREGLFEYWGYLFAGSLNPPPPSS